MAVLSFSGDPPDHLFRAGYREGSLGDDLIAYNMADVGTENREGCEHACSLILPNSHGCTNGTTFGT